MLSLRKAVLVLSLGTALAACQKGPDNTAANPAAPPAPATAPAAAPAAAPAPVEAARPERRREERRRDYSQAAPAPTPQQPQVVCSDCGTVTNIQAIRQEGSGTGMGAIAGAAAGGVLGHQVGGGRGKDVATVVGALAGAFGGNEAEKQIRASTTYKVTVAMDAGGTQTATVSSVQGYAVGSKVHVLGNTIQPE